MTFRLSASEAWHHGRMITKGKQLCRESGGWFTLSQDRYAPHAIGKTESRRCLVDSLNMSWLLKGKCTVFRIIFFISHSRRLDSDCDNFFAIYSRQSNTNALHYESSSAISFRLPPIHARKASNKCTPSCFAQNAKIALYRSPGVVCVADIILVESTGQR